MLCGGCGDCRLPVRVRTAITFYRNGTGARTRLFPATFWPGLASASAWQRLYSNLCKPTDCSPEMTTKKKFLPYVARLFLYPLGSSEGLNRAYVPPPPKGGCSVGLGKTYGRGTGRVAHPKTWPTLPFNTFF